MEKKYYNEINMARGIAILFVVAGHSFPDADLGVFNNVRLFYYFHQFFTCFHMPLFFTLAGFVFMRKYYLMNTFADRKSEIINKIKRIIVPYLTVSILTLFVKQVLAQYAYNDFNIRDSWQILIGRNPNSGMWFLWTLFMVTLIYIMLNKVNIFIITGCFGFLYIIQDYIQIQNIGLLHICQFGVYFGIGIIVAKYYEKIYFNLKRFGYKIPLITWIGLIMLFIINNSNHNIYINFVIDYLGVFACLSTSIQIDIKNMKRAKFLFSDLGTYSYDIYLLSYFVQIPTRILCFSVIGMPYVLCVILMFFMGVIVPYIGAKYIIRKVNILSKFVLGNWK